MFYFRSVRAPPATTALPNDPDPSQEPAVASTPVATRTGLLIGFLHRLIDYGNSLADLVLQRSDTPVPSTVAGMFGTMNVALILARILRGLRLASALEARLVAHPLREEAAPDVVRAPSDRAPRTGQPTRPRPSRATLCQLPDMPSAEEIAEAARHRPIGAVIVDICRDLGITQSHPMWGEVMLVVTEFGGNLVALVKDIVDRLCWWDRDPAAFGLVAWPESETAAACSTGPP
jgi:hypothetical protein